MSNTESIKQKIKQCFKASNTNIVIGFSVVLVCLLFVFCLSGCNSSSNYSDSSKSEKQMLNEETQGEYLDDEYLSAFNVLEEYDVSGSGGSKMYLVVDPETSVEYYVTKTYVNGHNCTYSISARLDSDGSPYLYKDTGE